MNDDFKEELKDAYAEIERLRTALRDVLSYVPHGDMPVTIYDNALAALNILDLDSVLLPPKRDTWI